MNLLPRYCLLCAGEADQSASLCRHCEEALPWQPPGCQRCALRTAELGPGRRICDQCLREPPDFDRCFALFEYRQPVKRLISHFKYHHDFVAGRILQQLLAKQLLQLHGDMQYRLPQLLIPTPLHDWKLRRRGYNQSLELARHAGRKLQLPVDRRCCRRRLFTPAQQGLSRQHRQDNMAQAFVCRETRKLTAVEHIAIIDDVVTTGATVNALSRCLRERGIARIDVWCLARVKPME